MKILSFKSFLNVTFWGELQNYGLRRITIHKEGIWGNFVGPKETLVSPPLFSFSFKIFHFMHYH